jgi:uncharacterized membrane protein YphA (DoxX/SURF4 family)
MTRRSVSRHGPSTMSRFSNIRRHLETNRHLVLDALRVYLGAGLFFRGLALLLTDAGLAQLTGGAAPSVTTTGVAAYVMIAHIIGGGLLAVGLYTRVAALVQLPVLAGAVVLVHWQDGLLSANQSLEFSTLVLFLLGLVLLFGGGRWSLDARRADRAPPTPSASKTK